MRKFIYSAATGTAVLFIVCLAVAQSFESRVAMRLEGSYRYIEANGIPDHPVGRFPNAHNPNAIAPQRYAYRVPAEPRVANHTTRLGLWPFGIALNGVPFDPGAAEFWNRNPRSGWQYEPMSVAVDLGLDRNNAHVQPNGAYHYHGMPTGLINELTKGERMTLVGYAADGFPIYARYAHANPRDATSPLRAMRSSYRLKTGVRTGGPGGHYDGTFVEDYEYVKDLGDLDECNGRYGVTPEFPEGTYYYVITDAFPYIPRLFRGTPDVSFERRGPGGRGPRRPGQAGPPPPRGHRPPPGGPGFPPPPRL